MREREALLFREQLGEGQAQQQHQPRRQQEEQQQQQQRDLDRGGLGAGREGLDTYVDPTSS